MAYPSTLGLRGRIVQREYSRLMQNLTYGINSLSIVECHRRIVKAKGAQKKQSLQQICVSNMEVAYDVLNQDVQRAQYERQPNVSGMVVESYVG